MLTSVASYLFGGSSAEDMETAPVELETKPAPDQDWVIVDVPDTACKSTTSPQAEILGHKKCCRLVRIANPVYSDSDSETASNCHPASQTPSTPGSLSPVGHSRYCLNAKIGFHESWILTPPPCFTAGGATSSQVGMDPMENLLIEHPSMSVYNSHCSGGSAGEESDLSESSTDNISRTIQKRGLRPRNAHGVVVQQSPRKPQALAARAQTDSIKSSQRSKQYKETRRLTRATIDRHNKTTGQRTTAKRGYNCQRINCPKSCVQTYQAKH
ncbi:tumor protein p53-inducible nuclear protein 1-like isoform X1 [Mizuhopecten yessoensis]|uniref:tumor protein p53-inducible nuclear protein 1-like isoform X1 n=1 Tax=Mizuhopecten yessoensis TaxID=6573 RepID=UPI000B458908|nr:tumor protein p53-inducible nuclear protein 1-like isoform X1 [Mizuhopecten yessoensis]